MLRAYLPKITSLEQAVSIFWRLRRQWEGHNVATSYTVSDANFILRQITNNNRFPRTLRRQVGEFQQEIVDPKARTQPKQYNTNERRVVPLPR